MLIPSGPTSLAEIHPQAVSQAEVVSLLRRSSVSEPTLPRRTLLVSLLLKSTAVAKVHLMCSTAHRPANCSYPPHFIQ